MTKTRALLRALGGTSTRGLLRVLELAGVALILPLVVLVDLLAVRRLVHTRDAVSRLPALRCPCGERPIPLRGNFSCGACGFTYRGRATDCPACGAEPNFWQCPCGVSVPSPANAVSRHPRRWQ